MVDKIKPKRAPGEPDAKEKAKRELLKEDEFITTSGAVFQWLQDNSKTVMVIIVLAFAGAGAVGALSWNAERDNVAATEALAEALRVYHRPVSGAAPSAETDPDLTPFATAQEKWKAAQTALEPVVAQHGSSGPGRLAQLYLADALFHASEYAAAADHYQAYLKSVPSTDNLRYLALRGLAHSQEAQGNTEEASKTYQEMAALPGTLGVDYGAYQAGRLLLASEDTAQQTRGRELLEKVTKDKAFAASPYRTKAQELLGPQAPTTP